MEKAQYTQAKDAILFKYEAMRADWKTLI
jgi:hypothetical protein